MITQVSAARTIGIILAIQSCTTYKLAIAYSKEKSQSKTLFYLFIFLFTLTLVGLVH